MGLVKYTICLTGVFLSQVREAEDAEATTAPKTRARASKRKQPEPDPEEEEEVSLEWSSLLFITEQ